jgi:hypothetical protein
MMKNLFDTSDPVSIRGANTQMGIEAVQLAWPGFGLSGI